MTVLTRIRLRSGDRDALDSVVDDIDAACQRKGAEYKGPHTDSPQDYRVPLYRRLDGDDSAPYPAWSYTVYQRRFQLRGYEDLVREIMGWEYPESVRVEVTVETKANMGST